MTDEELFKEIDRLLDKQVKEKFIGIRITKREYDEVKKSRYSFADIFRAGFNIFIKERFR